jgi:hypothetical protein
MRASPTTFVLLFLVASSSLAGQAGLKFCPLIDLREAAALTGPGVEFYSGLQSATDDGKKTCTCFFGVGEGRSLTVKTGPSLAKNAAEYQKMFEPLRKMSGATVEQGLGEYAYSKLEGEQAEITAVKGTLTLTFELKGTGLTAADMEKLRAAVKQTLPKVP